MRHVVVFDTNVLFSAIGWKGAPFRCLELARTGLFDSITCPEILEELAEKLAAKLGMPPDMVDEAVADLLTFHRIVAISGALQVVVADPDDDKIVECAVVGLASHIVSGDRRHLLPLGVYSGIHIMSPADFLQFINASP